MEIKVIRVYLTGAKRIHELYEEKQQALLKQEELRRAVRAQDRQMKGYGRDFEALLREREALQRSLQEYEILLKNNESERDEWKRLYNESEKARKSLGEKLEHALGALELLKEREGKDNPSVRCADTSPCTGEARAAEGVGPYSNFGPLGTTEGGARA